MSHRLKKETTFNKIRENWGCIFEALMKNLYYFVYTSVFWVWRNLKEIVTYLALSFALKSLGELSILFGCWITLFKVMIFLLTIQNINQTDLIDISFKNKNQWWIQMRPHPLFQDWINLLHFVTWHRTTHFSSIKLDQYLCHFTNYEE